MFLNTGAGGVDIFEVKLTFEMLTVRGQQRSFRRIYIFIDIYNPIISHTFRFKMHHGAHWSTCMISWKIYCTISSFSSGNAYIHASGN